MEEPNSPTLPCWLAHAWPRLVAARDAALAAGATPDQALLHAQEAAAASLSPALPATALREAMRILAASPRKGPP